MNHIDPSDAERNLKEVDEAKREASAALVHKRGPWAVAGIAVFAASVLFWLMSPEMGTYLSWGLVVVGLLAAVLNRSARWGWLTGNRARLTGIAGRRRRTLSLVLILVVLALFISINTAVSSLLGQTYPISGAVVGLLLALAGPPFAKWWMTRPEKRG
ncbi:hypothetical protein [Nocardiopsis listeri]|uniref:hypothetical protein n=1 Tax=Nocardiopsis listeri TaxID=53440 RepID=UPI000A6B0560|nr:hypothetical protein [Nocardiopsis listeri]